MKIKIEDLEAKYRAKFEKDVKRIVIYNDKGDKKGELFLYEYNDGVIEASILFDKIRSNNLRPHIEEIENE